MPTPADQLTTPEVYLRAAALIETYGHARGWYMVDGAYCVVGAVRAVLFGSPDSLPQGRRLDRYQQILVDLGVYLHGIGDPVYRDFGGLVTAWSDRSTPEHVVRTLRAAAAAVA